jgi:hypothetical protein
MVGLAVDRDPELWRTLLRLLENAEALNGFGARDLLPRFTDPNASRPVAAQILVWASSRGQLHGGLSAQRPGRDTACDAKQSQPLGCL